MSATPACLTPAPVPPWPLCQAGSLQPHHTTHAHSVTARTTSPRQHTTTAQYHLTHTLSMCDTITTNGSLRTPQVQRNQRHQRAQHWRRCRYGLCANPVPCSHATQMQIQKGYNPPYITHLNCTRLPLAPLKCNTITTNDSLRTLQVQRCQRHQLAQRRRQCRYAVCTKLVPCNHTTRAQGVTARTTSSHQHTSTAQHHLTCIPCTTRSQPVTAYVQCRYSDVSDTRLLNAGTSATMLSASRPLPAITPHTHTALQPALRHHTNTPPLHNPPHTRLPDHNECQPTYPAGPAMSATPGCPTPAPVPPCPLRQAWSLQNHTTHAQSVTA